MTNNYYFNFLKNSELEVEKNNKKDSLAKNSDYSQFLDQKKSSRKVFLMSCRSIENSDNEIIKFENIFTSSHNIVLWAHDYNDVFEKLKSIIKNKKAKSVRLPNVNYSTIFREIGLQYFIKDLRLKLTDDADIQFFAPDFLFSDTGVILLFNQSNNTLAKLNNSKTNVFFSTIDQIRSSSALSEIVQQFSSGGNYTAQDMIMFKGSPNCNNYLFIIDNQRTEVLRHKELRQSLICLHCNRCNKACPVFQTIGEAPYDNVFVGPIANVTLPLLETVDSYRHLVYACTLCGRCEEVCPVNIPIRDMILEERRNYYPEMLIDKNHRRSSNFMKKFLTSRKKMNSRAFHKRRLLKKYISADIKKSHRTLAFAKETFNKSYRKQ